MFGFYGTINVYFEGILLFVSHRLNISSFVLYMYRICLYITPRNCVPPRYCEFQNANITTQSVASPRTSLLSMISIVTFTFELWPPTSIGFTMVNMSVKFQWFSLYWVQAFFHTYPLRPGHLTPKINRVHPFNMVNISAKFYKEIHNGLVSILFTSLFIYLSIVTLIFDLWPP